MRSIVWVRIDDRLIHGQVMTMWLQHSGANEVIIVDDGVAKDSLLQTIMKSSMPATIGLRVMGSTAGAAYLREPGGEERIFLLVKTPFALVDLVDGGIELPSVNVGGMGARADRVSVYKNLSASEEEKRGLRHLMDRGVRCYFRAVYSDAAEDLAKHVRAER